MRWPIQAERFWNNVVRQSGCWPWMGTKNSFGYGRLRWDGRDYRAHRVAWIIHNGPILGGLWVLHKCDNPGCVNPEHLWLGTHKDNMRDCVNKGRFKHNWVRRFGESNASHKLSSTTVLAIKKMALNGRSHNSLAAAFSISQSTVTRIINGQRRKMG